MESQKASSGKSLPVSQALANAVASYNKNTNVRKWKVDSDKKKLITNLLKVPKEFTDLLADHYDLHRHTCSGEPPIVPGQFLNMTL